MTAIVTGAQVIVLMSCAVLAISLLEKVRRLLTGQGAGAILHVDWLRPSLAPAFLSLVVLVESGILLSLALEPAIGLTLAGALLVGYGGILSRRPPNDDCGCLGQIAPLTNRQALVRNVVLAVPALAASVIAGQHDLSRNIFTQTTLGATLIALAALAATAHILKIRRLIDAGGS
jgi:hypothetical protein